MKGRELLDFIKAYPEIKKHCGGLATRDDVKEVEDGKFLFVNTESVSILCT